MLEYDRLKAIALITLLIILLFLFIWYGSLTPAPEKGRFPGNDELVENYERYEEEKIEIDGEVIKTDPVTIEIESGERTSRLKLTGLQEEIDESDRISVFGTAEENETVHVRNAIIRPSWRYGYMYGISLLGAGWVGLRLIGGWRFDKENFAFEPRNDSLTVRETILFLIRGDGSG